ncbi:hypothetical protein [Erwinia tasmaniensis]|uniref:Uncharacterized protein n=1 Tax=Erwinia tasmaniensis (strain DSM 17950 / CFBP 7177 / CIP 109463 / NCPPB 4357 / Et1/99) TaxID=465817 RepID=B2VFQ3_ERWT9|nr:hypothetical protein [Erwinia tasmaniensis]CAO96355.1 Hypothetical protein ETA_13090 [Erwinia tasmaniensis Et1/99]
MTTSPASLRWHRWIMAPSVLMQTLNTTSVNIALPSMAANLHENLLRLRGALSAARPARRRKH